MATPPASTEASEIRRRGRRRLIGAIAIVVLLVVFVPMILDSEPHPRGDEPALAIPPKEGAPPLPQPVPATPAAPTASAAKAAKPVDSSAPKPASSSTPASPSALASPSAPAKAPPVRLEGFAVQVGAFHEEAKLRQAREKLAAAGVPHYTERLGTGAGELTRLRAGPFPTREAAEAALASLRRSALDGKVVPLP